MQIPPHSALARYALAALCIALAVGLRLLLEPALGEAFPFATLFLAVLVTAGYGGFGPALAATLLGAVASAWLLVPPHGRAEQAGLALYLGVGTGIALLGGSLRATRLRAEAAASRLALRTEELRTTLASIGDAVIVTDPDGRVASLNPVAEALTGWGTAEAAGRPLEGVFAIVNERTRQKAESPVARVLREGAVVGLANHTVLVARGGAERPIDDSAAPIRTADGRLVGVVLVFRDVTQRRRAEEAARPLAAIVESSEDAIVGKDLDGVITSWNAGAERLYGYSAEEVLGRPFSILVPPDRAGEVQETARRLRLGEHLEHFETVRRRKDGRLVDVSVSYSPIKDPEGRAVGAAVIARDVTQKRRAEEEAWERARQLQLITDDAPVLLAHCDAEHRFKFVNKPYAGRFGLHPRDLVGKSIPEVLGPEAYAVIEPHIRAALAGQRVEFEVEVPYRGLGAQQMQCAYAPERDPSGKVVGYVAAITNVTERRRVERALERAEARLAAIVDHSPAIIFLKDPAGRYLLVNRRFEELARASGFAGPYVGRTDAELLPAALAEQFRRDDLEVIRTKRVKVYEESAELAGERRTGLTTKFPLLDEAGEVTAVCGINLDITDRVQAEQALRQSEERLRLALEAGRMGVWDWNLRTGEIRWSDNLEPIHGLARGAFAGTLDAFRELIHPDDREAVLGAIARAVETLSSYDVEFRTVRPDRTVRWMAGKGQVFAEGGQAVRMVGVETDVTERKRAEQDARFLADASATLAALVDDESALQKVARLAVPAFADWCAVDVLDEGGSLRRLAVAHVDPSRVELAHELHRRFPPDPAAPQGTWNVVRTGKAELVADISDELLAATVKDPDLLAILGQLGLRSYMGVPLSVRGRVLGVVTFIAAESGRRYTDADLAVAEDLAHRAAVAVENARLYQEVREADRRKEEFLSLLAHELRNPLAPVRNGLEVLKLAGGNGQVAGPAIEMMERQVHHLVRLVDDLLDLSRVMRDRIDLRREPVELATVVARAVETSRPLIDAEGHQLSVALPPEPLWVHGDLVRLAQAVSNLLNNAARYTERGGQIGISAAREGGWAVLRVRDTGIGIAPEALRWIFEMFAQAGRGGRGSQGGLGIGLTLVRKIVELHGGTVEARSEGPGHGSEFVVTLPLLEHSESAAQDEGEVSARRAAARRVLVVDDNADAADSLALLLRLQGHAVRVAYGGQQALAEASAEPPDVAFLDIGMPGMDGHELARRFRAHPALRGVLLVALTGWGQEEDRRRTRAAGFDHHLVKPVELGALERLFEGVGAAG